MAEESTYRDNYWDNCPRWEKVPDKGPEEESHGKLEKGSTYRYRLTVEGSGQVENVKSDFKITIVDSLTFVDYDAERDLFRFTVKEDSYSLDQYDDPIVAQIVEMTNLISGIYDRLDFWVNANGEIERLNNRDEIQEKWEKVREYLTYKHPLSSYEIIMAKEKEMADEAIEIRSLSFIHFIFIYFFQFCKFEDDANFGYTDMDRFGSLVPFNVIVHYTSSQKKGETLRHFEGSLVPDGKMEKALSDAIRERDAKIAYDIRGDFHSDGYILTSANFSLREQLGSSRTMYNNLHLELITEDNE